MIAAGRRALLNPGIYAGVLLAFILVVAAYQVRPAYDIPIGTPTDGPLLRNFYDPETPPKDSGTPYATYRWSRGNNSSIVFQDVGRQDFDIVLEVNGSRPAGQPPPSLKIKSGDTTLVDVQPPPGVQDYAFKVKREEVRDGTVSLELQTNSFKLQGDARDLGIIVTRVKLSPAPGLDRFVEPPTEPLVAITGAVALLAIFLAVLGWGAGAVFTCAVALGLLSASLLVFDRLWLTSQRWYWAWPQSLIAGGVLAIACWPIAGWLFARGGVNWTALQRRALLSLVMLVFAVRLAGQLHPSIFVYDLGYHVNILLRVSTGDWLFTTQPAELGRFGHSTFYLPTPYIFMEPLDWLLRDHRLTIRLMTVGTGTLGGLPIFFLAARATGNGRAGLLSSALYLIMPMSVIIFSWGITPNIFGEFFALCSLAVAVGAYQSLRPTNPAFWALSALLTITILSHPGVLALSTVAFLMIALLWWTGRRRIGGWRPAVGLLGAYATAALVALAIYYRHFVPGMIETLKQVQQERANGTGAGGVPLIVGGSVEDARLGLYQREVHNFGEWFFLGISGFWSEAQAYYRVWPIVGAVVGYNYLTYRARLTVGPARGTASALVLAAIGWTVSVVLFGIVGWATNLFVRYPLFALPIIALGSGVWLSGVWRRGRAGRWLAMLLIVFFAVEALAFWQYRINFAFK
jgi:hypothetical protein